MSGTTIGGLRAAATRGQGGPGLREMRLTAKPGCCPFCDEPLAVNNGPGRKPWTCGAPECRVAYFRCWRRDQRHPERIPRRKVSRAETRRRQSEGAKRRWGSA